MGLPEAPAGIFECQEKNQNAEAPGRTGKSRADDVEHKGGEIKPARAKNPYQPSHHRSQNGSHDSRAGPNPLNFIEADTHGQHDLRNRNLDHALGKTDGRRSNRQRDPYPPFVRRAFARYRKLFEGDHPWKPVEKD
jgi:hypothetical protein